MKFAKDLTGQGPLGATASSVSYLPVRPFLIQSP